MKLYGHDTSVYVRRVRALLQEKGLPFERDASNVLTPSPDFAGVTPLMRVPALVDSGKKTLWDSRQIAEYLYEQYPEAPPPPPGHCPLQLTLWQPSHRYEDENVLLAVDAVTESAIHVFLLEKEGISREMAPYLRRQMQRVGSALAWLDRHFEGKESLAKDVFSFTDIALCCGLDWLMFRERYDVTRHANLARVMERHRDRPSLFDTHPSRGADWRVQR